MGKQIQRLILAAVSILLAMTVATAQDKQPADSLVRLMKASSVQMESEDSIVLRKTFDATFLHNGTYLICDTAVWNEANSIINASGNVKLIQGDAVLTSSNLDYFIDENVARFNGPLVEMTDKDQNILRTNSLDYYTKDSLARYDNGAVLKDHDGQIIESRHGVYDNKDRTFTFKSRVNMFTDSIFINTNELRYDAKTDVAYFETLTDFRREGNILSAQKGWYDRRKNLFFFRDEVHGMSEEQELWSDTLYFYRDSQNILLLGNARILDTVKKVSAIADYIFYEDSLSRVTMKLNPAVRMITQQEDLADTLYFRADHFEYQTIPYCEIDSLVISDCELRLSRISSDPVLQYREKVAEEARKRAEEAKKQLEEEKYGKAGKPGRKDDLSAVPAAVEDEPEGANIASADTLAVQQDTLAVQQDTLAVQRDTLFVADSVMVTEPVAPDTTKIGFLTALHDIRLFKSDMQMCCDSVRYCDLDSIARIFGSPKIWNDGNRQYTADSIDLQIFESRPYKADLLSGAFIVIEEEKNLCYDQIKGEEVVAYFDTTSTLSRFDALGGASALFFLKENDMFATVNMVDAKMITANFVNGEITEVTYFEKPKNNVTPIAQMIEKDKYLTGFNYSVERRPAGKAAITTREFPESERQLFINHQDARFSVCEKYFPGYITGIRQEIFSRRQESREREQNAMFFADSLEMDSSEAIEDTTVTVDSVALSAPDGISESISSEGNEAEGPGPATVDQNAEKRLQKQLERKQKIESARKRRLAEKQARIDRKAEKRRLKEEARKARREAKAASIAAKQQERDLKLIERYKKRYEKKLLRSIKADDVEDNL